MGPIFIDFWVRDVLQKPLLPKFLTKLYGSCASLTIMLTILLYKGVRFSRNCGAASVGEYDK